VIVYPDWLTGAVLSLLVHALWQLLVTAGRIALQNRIKMYLA